MLALSYGWMKLGRNGSKARLAHRILYFATAKIRSNLVAVEAKLARSINGWSGLGMEHDGSAYSDQNRTQQKEDMATLFERHRQLCDHVSTTVQTLALRPPPEEDRFHVDDKYRLEECSFFEWEMMRMTDPVLSPICHSILMIATERFHCTDTRDGYYLSLRETTIACSLRRPLLLTSRSQKSLLDTATTTAWSRSP
jgi:hypothetical protein